jgi:hypothetical protein
MPRIASISSRALLLASLVLLACCSGAPLRHAQPAAEAVVPQSSTVIYVIRRNWHVDIGFVAADLQPPLAVLRADFPRARYLLFGFGDRHYLQDHDHGAGGMLAALWPGAGLMLATALDNSTQDAFGERSVIELQVSPAQALQLQQFIWQSLLIDRGAPLPPLPGPYEGSAYFGSSQRYSALHTCNTWAAQALRAAGLPVHTAGVVLAGQLWVQARRLEGQQ